MKAIFTSTPSITAISILFLTFFFIVKHFSFNTFYTTTTTAIHHHQHQYHLTFYPNITAVKNNTTPSPPPPQLPRPVVERTGIVDKNGVMTDDFIVGEFDESLIESVVNLNNRDEIDEVNKDGVKRIKIEKFKVCDASMSEYIPCLDNLEGVKSSNSSVRGGEFERRCPENGKGLDCLVPRPKGYKFHIPWPKSRDEVWFDNVPLTHLDQDKGGQNQIERKKDKFVFPVDRVQFVHGVDQYLDQISKMAPDIAFGKQTRVALDIGCGVASFGAYLMDRNVTTLSIAPKDVDDIENQIQFALERGVPAMVAAFSTRRLLYPSQAFDLIHCSRCEINWTRDGGLLLLEVNRMLRGGGHFVWTAEPVYNDETNVAEQWKEMENLTRSLCWELVKREEHIAIWQKPVNNTCYLSRDRGEKPSLCDEDDNPDNVWYVNLTRCISRLPENGTGTNVTTWPERLHHPPERLFTINMDAYLSRREIYRAESKYWNDIVSGYVNAFHWKDLNLWNVMDMNARYGGFAAALHDFKIDCWVMNVVPVSGSNTLPVIYDRGLIGLLHDWCEPFDTYPRTYDLLNVAGLFSVEQKRCNISTIMLEMDRILRPGGRVYIRDTTVVINELQEIAKAMGWVTFLFDTGEGPHSNWKLLNCEKRL